MWFLFICKNPGLQYTFIISNWNINCTSKVVTWTNVTMSVIPCYWFCEFSLCTKFQVCSTLPFRYILVVSILLVLLVRTGENKVNYLLNWLGSDCWAWTAVWQKYWKNAVHDADADLRKRWVIILIEHTRY